MHVRLKNRHRCCTCTAPASKVFFGGLDPVMHFIRNQTELHTPAHFTNDMNVRQQ